MTSAIAPDPTTAVDPISHSPAVPGGSFAAIGGAVALVACNALTGFYPGTDSTAELVAWFGANAGLTELSATLGLIAAVLLVPGIWAVTSRLRHRTPVLAAVGGWAMATGYLLFTVLSIESLTTLSLLRAGADPQLLAEAADNQTPITTTVLYFAFGLGALIGTVVLGIAMLRQRGLVPVWAALAMILSAPVRMIGLFTGLTLVGPPLASILITIGFVGVLFARPGRDRG